MKMLEKLASAIQVFEGYKVGYVIAGIKFGGSISWRQNNPGNLRASPFQAGIKNGFAFFPTYQAGWSALLYQLNLVASGRSPVYNAKAKQLGLSNCGQMSLAQFFAVYAPSSDGNSPRRYADFVAGRLGIHSTATLRDLLEMA